MRKPFSSLPPSPPARLTRRAFLGGAAASLAGLPIAFAQSGDIKPLVVVLLRGGLDGLALTPPVNDSDYPVVRGRLALAPPEGRGGIVDLTNQLGLHPNAAVLSRFWRNGQMKIAPSVATPYRGTDAAIAERMLEGGLDEPSLTPQTGWLYRALSAASGEDTQVVSAGGPVPLLLQGSPDRAQSWQPPDFPNPMPGYFAKAATLYGLDPALTQALNAGTASRGAALAALSESDREAPRGQQPAHAFPAMARRLADAMADPEGPKVAVVTLHGWDTHRQQGASGGALARRIGALATGLDVLATRLGKVWDESAVLVLSAYGRTAAPNATGGTDHGVGTAWMLLGGSIGGSMRIGAMPKLGQADLLDNGGLDPTTDGRGFLAATLRAHWGLSEDTLRKTVFPGRPFDLPARF